MVVGSPLTPLNLIGCSPNVVVNPGAVTSHRLLNGVLEIAIMNF
jgi:hypothetical protein